MKKIYYFCFILITCLMLSNVYASDGTFFDTRGTKYEGVVERMAKLGIINGMNETTYAPNKSVTRAELAKIIVKMRGIENYAESVEYKKIFSDVKKEEWFYPYVIMASDLELINGYDDGTFKPNKEVTYAELVAILLRNLGYTRLNEEDPNGWYWNYIVKMREIALNDNIGEFDYTKPAKRGDVAMFVWNALITDRWAVSSENEKDGFTYTYAEKTPLEIYFDEYGFIDNQKITALVGENGKPAMLVNGNIFSTTEKVPLHVLGGNITALYKVEDFELIGVTFDEGYDNIKIVSGPIFYLKEQGYKLSSGNKSAYYGDKDNATYAYLIINEKTNEILRTVYLDATNNIIVNSISINSDSKKDDNDTKIITLNGKEMISTDVALVKNGVAIDWKNAKNGGIITNLGNGLYEYYSTKLTDEITDFKSNDEIWLGEDKYIISENCIYYAYKANESGDINTLSTKECKKYIGVEATIYLNVAEEVCKIEFGKTNEENEKYLIGYVTKEIEYNVKSDTAQIITVNSGKNESNRFEIDMNGDTYVMIGDLVAISEIEKGLRCSVIEKDRSFDNDIKVRYNYNAKEIYYPMIDRYIVNDDTKFYKVTQKYEKNSLTNIEECIVEEIELEEDELDDLMAYKLNIVYDENMKIIKVFAINEVNKFKNQVALVKSKKVTRIGEKKYEYKVTLNITESNVVGFVVDEGEYEKYREGDIIIFVDKNEKITLEECFKKESIGYKRDLIVKDIDKKTNEIILSDGSIIKLDEDIYIWNDKKINLNNYRIVMAEVSNNDGKWMFETLDMVNREDANVKIGDRIAIGEIDDVIVIYRGYNE